MLLYGCADEEKSTSVIGTGIRCERGAKGKRALSKLSKYVTSRKTSFPPPPMR
jgi:hypothetical protein